MALQSDTNYTLTGEQLEDLVSRIPVITMTTVDPGEGVDLAENHFIGVYIED
ncbi:hypothetical protein IJG14_01685 [bacterium]|nr:hypothetical protein [bacterium]